MANENMIKFYRGLVNNLPAAGANGALYITTDEGAIYYGTGTGMKRLGDFVQVANVASLPEKAHESCLYYCVAENILAKWNGTEWKQINKQPTAEELKVLLGLGSMAYLSEVSEDNLNSDLKAKVNAAAEGNHSHSNKALLDTYTQTEADLADAVAKKHSHTFVESELNKIADGDVAKWNSAEGNAKAYADEKIEALDFTDTAVDGEYVSAVNEVNGVISVTRKALPDYTNTYDAKGAANTAFENAKAYADGLASNYDAKGAAAGVKEELTAEINKKVTAVEGKDLIATSEIARLATLANYDDTKVKEDIAKKADAETMTTELGKKVDKVEGYSLVSDTEIARLAGISNYDDTTVKADIAKKADAEATTNALNGKVDKVTGYSLVSDTEIARLAEVDNYDDEEVRGLIGDNTDAIEALSEYVGTIPTNYTETNVIAYINKKAEETLAAAQGGSSETAASVKQQLDNYKSENDTRVKAAEDAIDAIEADYLKAEDKTELAGLITAEENRAKGVEESLQTQINTIMNNPDAEGAINSINEFTQYVKDHGTIAEGMRTDINKNKEDIATNAQSIIDLGTTVGNTYETKEDATAKLGEAKTYADGLNTAMDTRVKVLEAIDHDAYVAADAALKAELQAEIDADVQVVSDALATARTEISAEIDADVKALADGQVTTNKNDIATLFEMFTWSEF